VVRRELSSNLSDKSLLNKVSEDCEAGICYEGECDVAWPTAYSLDGKRGPQTGDKVCAGR
jgi:hypothetical protein